MVALFIINPSGPKLNQDTKLESNWTHKSKHARYKSFERY